MATFSSKKHHCLSLGKRVVVIERSKKGESARSTAEGIGAGKNSDTVHNRGQGDDIVSKDEILHKSQLKPRSLDNWLKK